MRRVLLTAALVLVLSLAFAVQAFANTTSGYSSWDEAYNSSITNQSNESPHQGYVYNTKKCAVCHAVHKGVAGGQLLLRASAADSCTFCHVTSSSGFKQVYEGVASNYQLPDNVYAHNYQCSNCHSVHGANTIQSAAVKNFVLRDLSTEVGTLDGMPNQLVRLSNAPGGWKTSVANRNQPITWFCAQCHQYYTNGAANNVTVRYMEQAAGSFVTTQMASHPMVPDNTFDYTPSGARGGLALNSANVAFAGSEYCRSCHDAGTDGLNSSGLDGADFPHYTPTFARFMTYADGASGTPTGSADSSIDGACLKCHRNGSSGVGFDY